MPVYSIKCNDFFFGSIENEQNIVHGKVAEKKNVGVRKYQIAENDCSRIKNNDVHTIEE